MSKTAMITFLTIILSSAMIIGVYADEANIKTSITKDNFYAVFEFTLDDSTIYENIKNSGQITADTVPEAIYQKMISNGLFGVDYFSTSVSFDDNAHAIICSFHLRGPSIINSTVDRTAMVETFRMNTVWRKFNLTIIEGFSYNFTQSLAKPIAEWTENTTNGITSFSYSNSTAGVSCSFELPNYATNIFAVGETIFFDAPYELQWEDKIINSPFLILIGLAVVGVIVFAYRKVR